MVNIPLQALWAFLKNPKVLVFLVVLALAGGAFWGVKSYVADVSQELSDARDAINRLSTENAAYLMSLKSRDETIKQVKQRLEDIIQINSDIEKQKLAADKKAESLQKALDDLTNNDKTPSEKSAIMQSLFKNEINCLSAASGGGDPCDTQR